jgi:hypothetical protein
MATTKKKGTSKQAPRGVVNSLSSSMKPRSLSERGKPARVIKVPAEPHAKKNIKPQIPAPDADRDDTGLDQLDPQTTPARPAAISRLESPAASPREISSRSDMVRCSLRRIRGACRTPPVWAGNRRTCCKGMSSDRAIDLNDSPARHRRHSSSCRAGDIP